MAGWRQYKERKNEEVRANFRKRRQWVVYRSGELGKSTQEISTDNRPNPPREVAT